MSYEDISQLDSIDNIIDLSSVEDAECPQLINENDNINNQESYSSNLTLLSNKLSKAKSEFIDFLSKPFENLKNFTRNIYSSQNSFYDFSLNDNIDNSNIDSASFKL